MAAIAVAVLFVANTGIAQAARFISPLPPVIIGWEPTPIDPTPEPPMPDPSILPPPPVQPVD